MGCTEMCVHFDSHEMCENHSLSHYAYLECFIEELLKRDLKCARCAEPGSIIEASRTPSADAAPHLVQTGECTFKVDGTAAPLVGKEFAK